MILVGLAHIAISTLVAYAVSLAFGRLTPAVSGLSLLVGTILAWRLRAALNNGFADLRVFSFRSGIEGWIERVLVIFILFASARQFIWLLYPSGHEIRTLNLSNYGDLPLHLNYIRQLAGGAEFPPMNPIFSPDRLKYPLGMDLYNALWEILGVRTEAHLCLVGLFATVASLFALRAWAGWWGIGGFFLNGGWAGWEFFKAGAFNTKLVESLGWKNLFLTVFITQRGVLFALPVGVLLLLFAKRAFSSERLESPAPAEFPLVQISIFGLLWGALALFHLHSFFILSLLIGLFFVVYRGNPLKARAAKQLLLCAVPIGAAFTLYFTSFFGKASIAHWRAGWMSGPEGFTRFAVLNFGPWLILAAALPFLILSLRRMPAPWSAVETQEVGRIDGPSRVLLLEWIVHISLFALFLNLILAPWAWDNVKILIWPYIGLLAVADGATSLLGSKSFSRGPFQPWLRKWMPLAHAGLALVLLYSGFAAILRTLNGTVPSVSLFSLAELSATQGALRDLPPDAVLAAAPTSDHTLPYFGRRRVLGYEGHNWSHGISTSTTMTDLESVMRSSAVWQEAAQRLRATHIFWGPAERRLYGDQDPVWKTVLPNVSPVAGYEIYALQSKR